MAPMLTTGAGSYPVIGGGGGYTGPGDIVTFAWWGGFRAYSAAKAGTKCIRVRAADTTQTDINSLANGSLDAATLAAFVVAHGACTIVTVYDQVGTNDATQATVANQPALTANALGTSYGMTFNGSSTILTTAGTYTQSQPYALMAVAKQTSTATDQGIIGIDPGSFAGAILNYTSLASLTIYAGTSLMQAATTSAFHAVQGLFNGASSVNTVDGAEVGSPGAAGAQSLTAYPLSLGASGPGSQLSAHVIMEGGYVAGTVSAGNRTSLNSNMHAAYGSW